MREKLTYSAWERVIENMARPTAIRRNPTVVRLLVLVALPATLSPDPAGAAVTFTVNKSGDAGDRRISDTVCDTSRKRGKQCTLRAAIQEANDTNGADTIRFNIVSSASVKTISPNSPLPDITEAVTING